MKKEDYIVGAIKGFCAFIFSLLVFYIFYQAIKFTNEGNYLAYILWFAIPFEILFFVCVFCGDWGNRDGKDK